MFDVSTANQAKKKKAMIHGSYPTIHECVHVQYTYVNVYKGMFVFIKKNVSKQEKNYIKLYFEYSIRSNPIKSNPSDDTVFKVIILYKIHICIHKCHKIFSQFICVLLFLFFFLCESIVIGICFAILFRFPWYYCCYRPSVY